MALMAEKLIAQLLGHAERVCEAVLGPDVSTVVSISVHIAACDLPPHIPATHEYMIVVDFSTVPELISEARRRLGSFLGKNVFTIEENATTGIYWGEGEPLGDTSITPVPQTVQIPATTIVVTASPFESIKWLKADTILPNWLDHVLFDLLGARHEPDWKRFEHNLDLNENEIKVYLGTYFPRSYAEAFCILDTLFDNAVYSKSWQNKTEASFLDVGVGTGGNLVGLLTVLAKHCPNLRAVTVHGFDGNAKALDTARFILEAFASQASFTVNICLSAQCIAALEDLPSPQCKSYDFITTFKMGGELVSSAGGHADDFYHRFLMSYAGLLSDIGLLILLDVTTKPDHTVFYPQLLNEQVSRFVRSQTELITLVPVPCHLYETRCSELCFTQKEFSITHRAARNDLSRVAYRILARKTCAERLHDSTQAGAEYVICNKAASRTFSTCAHSSGRGMMRDGYRITK